MLYHFKNLQKTRFILLDIDSRLEEIFIMIPEKVFAGLAVMTVVDFLQLPQVKEKLNLSQFSDKHSMKHSLGLQL